MLSPAILSKINQLWDRFYSGGIANTLLAMEQISYLLFMRRLDATDRDRAENADFTGIPYKTVFTVTDKEGNTLPADDLRWSSWRHLPAEDMLNHVRDKVFPFIKNLGGEGANFSARMQDAVFLIPKPSLLIEAVGILDAIYRDIDRERAEHGQVFHDTQGDIYEYLLSEIATSGKNGQFRTPRHLIQLIVAMVDPKLGDEICDPACGTGGFLLGSYQHIVTQHTSPAQRVTDENGFACGHLGDQLTDERQWQVLREQTLYGFDFDTTMVRIGLMNLMLHGIDAPNLSYQDTLGKRYDEHDRYDVVLATPPFKGSIDKGDIHEGLKLKTTKTELLFVAKIIALLRMGGRAGVIVPDGVLSGSSNAHQDLRKLLVDECQLQGVLSMPAGVFKPYAGVSTGVLFFVKGGRTDKVWFYDMTADGRSLDDKREKVKENDIPDVLARWRGRDPARDTDRAGKAFFVGVEEIRAAKYDLSINRYKQVRYEAVEHEAPGVILARLRDLEAEISREIEELGGMV